MYWSRNEFVGIPGVKKTMSRDMFLLIMQFFHLNDNVENLPREDENHDRLFKLRKFMDMIVPLWQKAYYPGREVAVNETLIAFKERTAFKQYKPNKPHSTTSEVWRICHSLITIELKGGGGVMHQRLIHVNSLA